MSFIEKAKKKLGDFADSAKDAVKRDGEETGDVEGKAKGSGEKVAETGSSTIDKVKSKQGIISKIQDIFTLGYSTKEDLR